MEIEAAITESAKVFGRTLKEKQLEAITAFAKGNDTFIALPTGYGKSLCYGILPHVFDRMRGKLANKMLMQSDYITFQATLVVLWCALAP